MGSHPSSTGDLPAKKTFRRAYCETDNDSTSKLKLVTSKSQVYLAKALSLTAKLVALSKLSFIDQLLPDQATMVRVSKVLEGDKV